MSDIPKGRFVWYDLMTTDPKGAQSFYKDVIGWGTAPFDGPMPYTMWTNGETPIGGVNDLPEEAKKAGAPPHWLSYIATPSVDETVDQAKGLGAKVLVEPQDIPTVGRFAILADPMGAAFAVYTPANEPPGHDGPANKGEFSWHELMSDEPEKAWDFYSALFGWEKTDSFDMGPEVGPYQMYGRAGEGFPLGGIYKRPKEMPTSAWLYYARVDDVHETVEQVKAKGGQVLNGPMEVPGGDFVAQCIDPQGSAFALHSTKRA